MSFVDRRSFLKAAAVAGSGLWVSRGAPSVYAQGGSPIEKVRVAVMGVNGRGQVLARAFAEHAYSEVAYICDVDQGVLARSISELSSFQTRAPLGEVDFRRTLDDPLVDALVIAAPDHWHTPAAILALQAGKHVYVEKPASHNGREGELLVDAQRRHRRVVQMGNQQRSNQRAIEIIGRIHEGVIGRVYFANTWYANARASIGRGIVAAVPSGLDYELWQGPAPRRPYRSNVIPYNWHWFKNWGTGEICNNGTHELDIARWALQVEHPVRVTSAGGRYHFDDDWEFPDTQDTAFDFEGGKTIVWQGRSCNGFPILDRARGVSIHGTNGTVVVDRSGYAIYDLENEPVEIEWSTQGRADALDTRGGDSMTDRHIANFVAAIRAGEPLRSPIDEGQKSVRLCHLGNIAQEHGGVLQIDSRTGRIVESTEAARLWGRSYERGWSPTV